MFKSVVYLSVNYESNYIILQVTAHTFQHLLNNQSVSSLPM